MNKLFMTLTCCMRLTAWQTIGDTLNLPPHPSERIAPAKPGSFRSVIVQASDAGAPFVINDNGIRTNFRIINMESRTAEYLIQFLSPTGGELNLPLEGNGTVNAMNGTIAPNSMLELQSTGSGSALVGWAVLVSTSAKIATQVSIQTRYADGSWHSTTHHAANALVKRLKVPYDNRGGYASSVLLANPNSEPASLSMVVRDAKGEVIGRQSYTLAASSCYSINVAKTFAGAAEGTGSVELAIPANATLGLLAAGLRVHDRGAIELLDALALTEWGN